MSRSPGRQRSIVLGATLTEMTRTFRHQPYRAEDHVARLYRSLKYSGIAVPLSQEEMLARTNELAEANCKLLRPDEDIGIVELVWQESETELTSLANRPTAR